MGSDSDWPVVEKAVRQLQALEIETEVHVIAPRPSAPAYSGGGSGHHRGSDERLDGEHLPVIGIP